MVTEYRELWTKCGDADSISAMTQELFDELAKEFWRTAGVMTFAQVAIKKLSDDIPWTVTKENPDPNLSLSPHDPNDPKAVADASWRKSQIEGAAATDGWLQQWLTHAWLATMFARWEAHYRPAFADANGVEEKQVRSDVIGDIRNLRNDVIHHRGIATKKNTGKCKVLTQFNEGDMILLRPEDVRLLRDAMQVEIVRETDT